VTLPSEQADEEWQTPRPARQPKTVSVLNRTELDNVAAWQTPEGLVEAVHGLLGGIELDPCTSPENPTRADYFYTASDDGILQPWNAKRIYVNPPYGKTISHWIDKSLVAAAQGAKVVLLVPARPGSAWFRRAWEGATEALFINGRLRFKGADASARFPSVIFAYNLNLSPLAAYGLRAALL